MSLILIVDDNVDACRPLARLLSNMGSRAVCVESGELALAYLRVHRPRLILLDLNMPGMDGMTVLAEIRANPETADIPVVIFSASSLDADIARAKELGANDYWIKSRVDYRQLQKRVSNLVGAGDV